MSKRAIEICIRCPECGGFEMSPDWRKCVRKEVQNVQCNKCGAEMAYCNEYRGRIVLARRTRKNREARLRNKMRVLDDDVKYNMECVRFWRKKCKRFFEYQETSTYGQDVEGS